MISVSKSAICVTSFANSANASISNVGLLPSSSVSECLVFGSPLFWAQ